MARTMVVRKADGAQAPFLRGILTQSLVNAGLGFEEAYGLAREVRSQLRDAEQISSTELGELVYDLLVVRFGPERGRAYRSRPSKASDIIVHTPTRSETFSMGILAHSLETCAIDHDDAMKAAHKVHAALRKTGHKEINHKSLRRLVYRCLHEHCSDEVANRYLSWRRFENSGAPLIILIGGITGSGKSTLASELGYRLDIGRTQSTDMIRAIIRAYLAEPVAPTLQYSSFEAWRGLPTLAASGESEVENLVVTGFLSQFTTLKPALDSAIARAVHERERLILEGVHVLPTELDLSEAGKQGIVLPVMIATMRKQALSQRLKRRGRENSTRSAQRYLQHIDEIWELQSYLLGLADAAGITIIQNWNLENTIAKILELLSSMICDRFPPDPSKMDWEA